MRMGGGSISEFILKRGHDERGKNRSMSPDSYEKGKSSGTMKRGCGSGQPIGKEEEK